MTLRSSMLLRVLSSAAKCSSVRPSFEFIPPIQRLSNARACSSISIRWDVSHIFLFDGLKCKV